MMLSLVMLNERLTADSHVDAIARQAENADFRSRSRRGIKPINCLISVHLLLFNRLLYDIRLVSANAQQTFFYVRQLC